MFVPFTLNSLKFSLVNLLKVGIPLVYLVWIVTVSKCLDASISLKYEIEYFVTFNYIL